MNKFYFTGDQKDIDTLFEKYSTKKDGFTTFPDLTKIVPPSSEQPSSWWLQEHWGTKRNTYDFTKLDSNVFEFFTAWGHLSRYLIAQMLKDFSSLTLVYRWADIDDFGAYSGKMIASGTQILDYLKYEEEVKESYELSFSLVPERREDYDVVDGNYKLK